MSSAKNLMSLMLLGVATLGAVVRADIWYVDSVAVGAETGTSWQDAFTDLHDALAVAQADDEIWIAAGTYKPDRGKGDRSTAFELVSGVGLYGGFSGSETQRDQRDWEINETILSGDLNGDDGPVNCPEVNDCCQEHAEPGCGDAECQAVVCEARASCCQSYGGPDPWVWDDECAAIAHMDCCHLGTGNLCDNSFRVLQANGSDAATSVDGLTIKGGYASPTVDRILGAGISIENGSMRAENCEFSGNFHGIRQYGDSRTEVSNCSICDNLVTGIVSYFDPTLTVRSSMISSNNTGIYFGGGDISIGDTTFRDNLRAGLAGGAWSSNAQVVKSVFVRNGDGGIAGSAGYFIVRDCLFAENTGGAGFADFAIVERCTFLGNSAYAAGALVVGGVVSVRDSLFMGNFGHQYGCMYLGPGVLRLRNSAVVGNRGGISGGLLVYSPDSLAIVDNTIFWDNAGYPSDPTEKQQIRLIPTVSGELRINHSIVQGWTGSFGGVGNSGDDPRFVDADGADDIAGTHDDDLRLRPGSPAINAGDPTLVPAEGETDFDGRPRILCGRVDVGAFEVGIGDYDCDGAADLFDFLAWIDCMTGPSDEAYDSGCEAFDFDADIDIDLADFGDAQRVIGWP